MKAFIPNQSVTKKVKPTIEIKIPDDLLFQMWKDKNKWEEIIKDKTEDDFMKEVKWFLKENNLTDNCFNTFEKVKWNKYIWIPNVAAKVIKIAPSEKPIVSIFGSLSKMEYESIDGSIYSYTMEEWQEPRRCIYPSKKRIAEYNKSTHSDADLFHLRSFLQENPDTPVICYWNISNQSIISSDIKNIISVWGYINISWNKFESSLSFPELVDIQDYFYFTDRSGGEGTIETIRNILPKVSDEYIEDKCMELNIIENQFYREVEVMNDSLEVMIDNHWNPEAFHLFSPLFNGIRPDILWFQELVQWVKNISPSYLVMLDKRNIPNDWLFIEHRKHLVYLNKIEAVIKIPKWAIKGNDNENYILINKPQAEGWIPKNILFMDLTKKFPKDMKKVLSVIDSFLNDRLFVSDTFYKSISKQNLKEPYILEPSFYI